jgi:hypothetical protein
MILQKYIEAFGMKIKILKFFIFWEFKVLWVYKGGIGHPYPYLSSEKGVNPPDSKRRCSTLEL